MKTWWSNGQEINVEMRTGSGRPHYNEIAFNIFTAPNVETAAAHINHFFVLTEVVDGSTFTSAINTLQGSLPDVSLPPTPGLSLAGQIGVAALIGVAAVAVLLAAQSADDDDGCDGASDDEGGYGVQEAPKPFLDITTPWFSYGAEITSPQLGGMNLSISPTFAPPAPATFAFHTTNHGFLFDSSTPVVPETLEHVGAAAPLVPADHDHSEVNHTDALDHGHPAAPAGELAHPFLCVIM